MADGPPDVRDTLKRLTDIRQQLRERLAEVEVIIRELEGVQARMDGVQQLSLLQVPHLAKEPLRRKRGAVPPVEIADLVEKMIRDRGRPMVRSEVARALAKQGVPLAGKDKNKNVGTILWRHRDRFVNLPKLGYWLAKEILDGVYDPLQRND